MKLIKDESQVQDLVFFPIGIDTGATIIRRDGSETTSNMFEVYNKNTSQTLYWASKRYGLLPHKKFIDNVESNLSSRGFDKLAWGPNVNKEEKTKVPHKEFFISKDGGSLRARYFLPTGENISSSKKDQVGICLDARNSINGKSREQLRMGSYRFVCSNGMIGFNSSVTFSKKHTAGNFGTEEIDDNIICNQFDSLWKDYSADLEIYKVMDSQVITKHELENIIKKMPVGKNNPDKKQRKNNHFDSIHDIVLNSRFDGDRSRRKEFTLWELFNATTEHLTHNVEREQGRVENADRLQGAITPFFKRISDGILEQKPLMEILNK